MKQRPWIVLLWFVSLVLVVGLACSFPGGSDEPTKEPEKSGQRTCEGAC